MSNSIHKKNCAESFAHPVQSVNLQPKKHKIFVSTITFLTYDLLLELAQKCCLS